MRTDQPLRLNSHHSVIIEHSPNIVHNKTRLYFELHSNDGTVRANWQQRKPSMIWSLSPDVFTVGRKQGQAENTASALCLSAGAPSRWSCTSITHTMNDKCRDKSPVKLCNHQQGGLFLHLKEDLLISGFSILGRKWLLIIENILIETETIQLAVFVLKVASCMPEELWRFQVESIRL